MGRTLVRNVLLCYTVINRENNFSRIGGTADIMDKYKEKINKYQDLKMLELHDSYLRPTELGLKYLNNILVDFLD